MLKAKKSLGQNFLVNVGVARKIVGLLDPQPDEMILEIGPGRGALTSLLAAEPLKTLLLLEKDWELTRPLTELGDATALNIDALTFPWEKLGALGSWKLIGNLPYNVASPILWDIASLCDGYTLGVFMVQKEAAERIVAAPGGKNYGALSVWIQSFAHPRYEFTVKPNSFRPAPKVESAVISLRPASEKPTNPASLKNLLSICFQNRRKQAATIFKKNNLESLVGRLEELGYDAGTRPERISVPAFNALAEELSKIRRANPAEIQSESGRN